MPEESKEVDQAASEEALREAVEDIEEGVEGDETEEGQDEAPANGDSAAASAATKKKKSKKKKLKAVLAGGGESSAPKTAADLSGDQMNALLDANPALKKEVQMMDPKNLEEMMKRLDLSKLLAPTSGKNAKDMDSYKFWQTQPVLRFDEKGEAGEDGPLKQIDIERVRKEPYPLPEGFEYVTMDLTEDSQINEVYDLLTNHYVEDDEAMFRFNYSVSFLDWALKAPGWRKEWHIGVRASKSQKLIAFISGIPVKLRVRKNLLNCSEINFMCVHKKLRAKRLAPELIKEVTRRCYLAGIFQAIYTGGIVLPTPVATCRYFHRSLNWQKLYECGFSQLPHGSTPQRQSLRYHLPSKTETLGLRIMERGDVDAVQDLLNRYLARTDMAQEFSMDEVIHWLLPTSRTSTKGEQVVWSYVVSDPQSNKITDFFSFYLLESSALASTKHKTIRAGYLFYYATETAFQGDQKALKQRLNLLNRDALILAKKDAGFDVMNALTHMDNPLFLTEQKYGPGDGQLHYYLYNYRTAPLAGGIDTNNAVDEKFMGGVGVVML